MMSIHWGSPSYLWIFPLFFIACGLLWYRARKKITAVELLAKSNKAIISNFSTIKNIFKAFLLGVGLFFLFLALLSPQWTKKEETVIQEGRDVLIALDVSRSMLATDVAPNRLQKAKNKIKQLLNQLSCERVGLILFSGAAFVQCPLTTDYRAFLMFLDQVDVETISSGSTLLDQPIKKALDSFQAMPERKSKLLVLFTDGEDFSSNLAYFKKDAVDQGLHIFTVGVGTPQGAPIPLYDEHGNQTGHQKDDNGSVVISKLNEPLLYSLAHDVGGTYIKVTENNADIIKLKREVERFEKDAIDEQRLSHYENQYAYFILISFICFILEWLL